MDFAVEHDADGFLSGWAKEVAKITDFLLSGNNVKEKNIRCMLRKLKTEDIGESKCN